MNVSLYLAGPLFNLAQRRHNSELELALINEAKSRSINLSVTSPQRKALDRFISSEKGFDINGIVSDCIDDSIGHDIGLFNLDGSDADSGTAVEYGIALGQRIAKEISGDYAESIKVPHIITYRTDFRTAPEKEVGINAMLRAKDTHHIYSPCFAVELSEFPKFYQELSKKIVNKIEQVLISD